jgi:hypothetical protein
MHVHVTQPKVLAIATFPDDAFKVKELLGYRHVTTTQIYDKRRRRAKKGASHDVPI